MTVPSDERPLTIGFDGRALTSPAAGVRRYTHNLLAAFAHQRRDRIIAVGPRGAAAPDGIESCAAGVSLPTNFGWSVSALPRAVERAALDVFHAPSYTAPMWGSTPVVVTIHDVSYARHREWYPWHLDPVRSWFYRRSAHRARRVITDSSFSRDEIVAAYGLSPDTIDVVPLGVSPAFVPDPSVIREPIVLHVGDLHVRRNLSLLLDEVIALRAALAPAIVPRLVVAGKDRGELTRLRSIAAARGANSALEYVGEPTDAQLIALYRRARVLAYPSRYEGFGLPVVEAMACGTPVIASTAGALPEVCGGAALLIDPDDARGWSEALSMVFMNATRAADLSSDGIRRTRELTWERCAELTRRSYVAALGNATSPLSIARADPRSRA